MNISSKYEVLAEIGRGGMGIVYKVRHTSLETEWAAKILPRQLADDAELVARFHREARVMAQLRHPNIVRVIDVDKTEDLHYFVMEYVDGKSLSHILSHDGPRSLASAVDIGIQVARGLAYAHGQRTAVIHRDIKPSNIMIEAETGRAVITDFGLAKLADGAESIRTESGKFIGTLRYCAPEQLAGTPQVDARIDVYALGMVIYEAYVGRSVYVDLERPQVIAGLLQLTTAHPFQFPHDAPENMRALIARATAKDRDGRHPTVAALLDDLLRVQESVAGTEAGSTIGVGQAAASPVSSTGAPWRTRAVVAGAVASVGVALGAGYWLQRSTVGPPAAPVGGGAPAGSPSPAGARGAVPKPAEEPVQKFISVMDFSPGSPDPSVSWMRDAIRDNLNSRLSSAPDCKVFSKEFIDFKAQQMVREGQHQDLRAATMEVAEKLGVRKAVLGSFRAERERLQIEAHIVDMQTGVQEASETVEGDQRDFIELQTSLAKKLMARLGLKPTVPEPAPVAAAGADDLENYRLLLQAEGQTAPIEPTPVPKDRARKPDRRGKATSPWPDVEPVRWEGLQWLGLRAAWATEDPAPPSADEVDIRKTLEKYRAACTQKDLTLLGQLYDHLSPAQIDANRRYFENARDLDVAIEDVDVALGRDEAAVSYTRRDRFTDNETGRPTKVEVRLTKILVRVNGSWVFSSGGTRR